MEDIEPEVLRTAMRWLANIEKRLKKLEESKPIFTGTISQSTANPHEHRTEAPIHFQITEGSGCVQYCDEDSGGCLRPAWGLAYFHFLGRPVCKTHAIEHLRRIADSIERNG